MIEAKRMASSRPNLLNALKALPELKDWPLELIYLVLEFLPPYRPSAISFREKEDAIYAYPRLMKEEYTEEAIRATKQQENVNRYLLCRLDPWDRASQFVTVLSMPLAAGTGSRETTLRRYGAMIL